MRGGGSAGEAGARVPGGALLAPGEAGVGGIPPGWDPAPCAPPPRPALSDPALPDPALQGPAPAPRPPGPRPPGPAPGSILPQIGLGCDAARGRQVRSGSLPFGAPRPPRSPRPGPPLGARSGSCRARACPRARGRRRGPWASRCCARDARASGPRLPAGAFAGRARRRAGAGRPVGGVSAPRPRPGAEPGGCGQPRELSGRGLGSPVTQQTQGGLGHAYCAP